MKKFLPICLSSFLLLPFLFAQPAVGTWTSQDDAFPPGDWQELLYGGGEGQPGNEIQALSAGFYSLAGATIQMPDDVIQIQACEPVGEGDETVYTDFIYETVYSNGTLELVNAGTPWETLDPSGAFAVSLGPILNVTTKFTEEMSCDLTGVISFDLSGFGTIDGYEGYHAFISAHYAGTPTLGGSDPVVLSDTFVDTGFVSLSISPPAVLDIKPGSCVNPFNVKTRGVLPVALLGSELVDVSRIALSSLLLEGVPPLRWSFEDVTGPEDCGYEAPDGFLDLVLKFSSQEVLAALGEVADGDEVLLSLTADLDVSTEGDDGSISVPLIAQDFVSILDRGRNRTRSHFGEDNGNHGEGDSGNHYGEDNGNHGEGDSGNHYGEDNGNHGEGNNGNHYGEDNGNHGEGEGSNPDATGGARESGNKGGNGKDKGNNGVGKGGNG